MPFSRSRSESRGGVVPASRGRLYCEPPMADDFEVGAEGPGRISDSELDFLILLLVLTLLAAAPPFPFLLLAMAASPPPLDALPPLAAAPGEIEAEEGEAIRSSMRSSSSSSSSSSVLGLRAAALTIPWL